MLWSAMASLSFIKRKQSDLSGLLSETTMDNLKDLPVKKLVVSGHALIPVAMGTEYS